MKKVRAQFRRVGATALLLVMGILWGLQFAMLKQAAQGGYSDLTVMMIALILLSIIFLLIAIIKRERFRPSMTLFVFFVVTAFFGYVAPLAAALYAASELSAGVLVLFASMTPLITISIVLLLRTETVSAGRIVAVGLGILSVTLILWPEFELPNRGKALWMLVALVIPVSFGTESVYTARFWPAGLSALHAVTGATVAAAFLVAPVFILSGNSFPEALSWNDAEVAILVFVGAGVIESLLYFVLIQKTGGVFVSFGNFVSLFAGLIWGILLFSEVHTNFTWFAVGILIAALVLASKDPLLPVKIHDR